ncbi:MAG TPA: type I restriction endonuclease, partial [Candidatus Baltobacteraceae bacterium]|nr:type I restriction endonuclease [Candidatus Baltobacteraceae bacterium]
MSFKFTESVVEEAALSWLREMGYGFLAGPDIAPEQLAAERADFLEAVLSKRLKAALRKLNPNVPAEALEDAYRKITIAQSPSAIANNRIFHRMLVEGVEVEYRRPDGS